MFYFFIFIFIFIFFFAVVLTFGNLNIQQNDLITSAYVEFQSSASDSFSWTGYSISIYVDQNTTSSSFICGTGSVPVQSRTFSQTVSKCS
jgi:hypothetical protein